MLPFLTEVAALLGRALDEAQNHTTHWSAMAAFSLALLGMGLVVAFRITGYRVTGFSIAGAAIGYGVVSLIFPFDASSHRFGYSVGLILWGLAWLGILRFADNPSPAPSRSTVIPLVKWVLIVPVLFVVSAIWLANDDQPNVPHRPDPNHPELLASDVDAQTCLDCHATRIAGAPQPPHELNRKCEDGLCWGGRTDCAGCHQIDPELGGPTQRIEVVAEPVACSAPMPGWRSCL